MTEFRSIFHAELNQLEVLLLDMAKLAEGQINQAVDALLSGDARLARQVVEQDRNIDQLYVEVERRWHEVMARQTPVASDLRLMSLILQAGHSLERMGDQASNIAKIVEATSGLPTNQTILLHIQEMRSIVVPMIDTAMEALVKRDLNLAMRLPELDDPADWLNRNMWKEVAACASDPDLLEWAIHMMLVSRALERVGDRAVDIGEQVAFLLTGEQHEFPEGWVPTPRPA
ncbi:MAG: phosphate signaling complex protein PhoU [Acidimicrobiia bacterium]|nr:phosphate signaling complex protein PhoU [bacterium]MXX63487.1 phosphate signaling complex protein PhoU [Acidimicrobiia bacterium]MXZ06085.1 phosphate signaling complex protein PhoU [Acidimicrobiia bacterium]MYD03602.1 phosphate signaling complex protein PhoU [Acidimicrobiia bacterium]MYF27016.1 phosphate signaling complex protein PhoU [Acidimicrobiia bacterium]